MPTTTITPAPVSVAQIRRAEKLLKKAGFDPGKVDGKVDETLTKAVKQFQTAWGTPATGELNARTLARLDQVAERIANHKKDGFVSVGQKSGTIKTLEQRLARLGYDVGRADGVYSRETAEAVKKFKADQKELRHAKESGALGKKARTVLRREVEAVKHAPERRRVKSTGAQQKLDSLTAKAAQAGLTEGARGQAVANVQKHLRAAGFDPKNVAGVFDERTAGAVKNFQLKAGLKTTGEVNAATWAKLKKSYILNEKAPVALHERSGKVRNTEKLLKKAGFNPGRVDGFFDRSMEKAVKRFEQKHGLKADGRLTAGEYKKLVKAAHTVSANAGMKRLAANAKSVALSMGGYSGLGLCATGVSRAIAKTYGISVWGNGNQIDNNLPRSRFKRVHMPLSKALKIPGLILTWEQTSTSLGRIYGHTAVTLGDGRSSASDFVETNTLGAEPSRKGLKIFMPIK